MWFDCAHLADKPLKFKFTPEGQAKLNKGKAGQTPTVEKLVWARPGTLEFESGPDVRCSVDFCCSV